MSKKRKCFFCLLFFVLIPLNSILAANNEFQNIGFEALRGQKLSLGLGRNDLLLSEKSPLSPGDSVSDWLAMTSALLGAEDDYASYLERLQAYVTDRYALPDRLDPFKATEWHRISLTVLALGGDPTSFGVTPNGDPIDLIADGTYAYVNGDVGLQGLNGYIYALLVLDALPNCSEEMLQAKSEMLQAILCRQNEDGGFSLVTGASEIDMTAMALQALAPYREGEAKEAVENAVDYLRRNQEPDGGFGDGGETSCESAAQVIIALCALELDPNGDALRKPMGTPLDSLLSFQQEDGTFSHSHGGKGDSLATSQALLALSAIHRYSNQNCRVFYFDHFLPAQIEESNLFSAWIILPAAFTAAIFILFILRGRRKKNQ